MGIVRRGQIHKKILLFGFLPLPCSQGSPTPGSFPQETLPVLGDNAVVLDSEDVSVERVLQESYLFQFIILLF